MGAMKSWAAVLEELAAAREHWEQCNHAAMSAVRAELEAHVRLERAKAEHQREIRSWIDSRNAPETREDAPGTAPRTAGGSDSVDSREAGCGAACDLCQKPVSEDEYGDTPHGDPVLHDACRAEYNAGRAEHEAECRAEAQVMYGYGRGSM